MARGKFRSLSVSETTYNKLREIASRRGFSTLSDTVAYLVTLEELVLRKLESVTTSAGNITRSSGNVTATAGNTTTIADNQPAQQKSKRTAWEILEERGVSCVSEMKVKDPDFVMDKLVEGGAYVVSWDKDKCAILPETYEGLLKLLPEVKVSDPERVVTLLKARDSRYARVFRVLYKAGALYYDKEKGWQVDEESVEKGGEVG